MVGQPVTTARAAHTLPHTHSGWAVDVYSENSAAAMENGANVVFMVHINLGIVNPERLEPGLSYVAYEAVGYRYDGSDPVCPSDPRHVRFWGGASTYSCSGSGPFDLSSNAVSPRANPLP